MLVVRHHVQGPNGEASWRQEELRSRDLVFVRSRYLGAVRDEAYSPEHAEGCSSIRFVLEGPIVARAGGARVDVRRDELVASAIHGTCRARTLTRENDVLIVGWRTGRGAGERIAHDVRLAPSRATVARLRGLASLLTDRDTPATSLDAAASEVVVALRAEGFPLSADAVADADAETRRLACAVQSSLASLSSRPTSVDLSRALGVGEHHALRRANEWFRRFYFSVNGWREYLRVRRLDLGSFFMGHPAARTEDVSRVLGFRSPTSFCHAFQAAGLPSPRAVQSSLLTS